MADLPTHKQVGSQRIELTPEEAAAIKAEWDAWEAAQASLPPPPKTQIELLEERIAALEGKV